MTFRVETEEQRMERLSIPTRATSIRVSTAAFETLIRSACATVRFIPGEGAFAKLASAIECATGVALEWSKDLTADEAAVVANGVAVIVPSAILDVSVLQDAVKKSLLG